MRHISMLSAKNKKVDISQMPPLSVRWPSAFSPVFWLKIFITVHLIFLAAEFSPDISTNGDDAKYYIIGKSLLSGNGYRDMYTPQNKIHTEYPPVFPAFLGIVGAFTTTPLIPKIAVGILSAGVLLLLFYYLRAVSPGLALAVVLMTAFSTSLASHATLLLSEIPYLFATLAALVLLERYRRRGGTGLVFWAAASVAVLPPFIRTVGISFVAAWVVTNVLDKKYRQAAAHLALFIAAMVLLRVATEWHSSYVDSLFRKNAYDPELGFLTLGEMIGRMGQNIYQYLFGVVPHAILGVGLIKNTSTAVALLIAVVAGIGWVRNFVLPSRFLSWYLLFYGGILSMWQPQWTSERMLIPAIPFLTFFLLLGIETVLRFLVSLFSKKDVTAAGDRFKTGVLWAAALLIVMFNCNDHLRLMGANEGASADWRNFYSCADWIRLNTPRDAIVVSRKPELFYLRSLRKGFIYPYSHDAEKIIAAFREGGARYCVLDNFFWTGTTGRYLYPAVTSHADMFRIVYSVHNPDTYVLEFEQK